MPNLREKIQNLPGSLRVALHLQMAHCYQLLLWLINSISLRVRNGAYPSMPAWRNPPNTEGNEIVTPARVWLNRMRMHLLSEQVLGGVTYREGQKVVLASSFLE